MAEPCGANSSRSEGTSQGQGGGRPEQQATADAEAGLPASAPAPMQSGDAQERHAAAPRPASPLGALQDLVEQPDALPMRRTRRQTAARRLRADFVGGEDSDSDADREPSRRAGSSASWHPGDRDSDSDASTRKRCTGEAAQDAVLFSSHGGRMDPSKLFRHGAVLVAMCGGASASDSDISQPATVKLRPKLDASSSLKPKGLAQGTISFVPGQSQPVRTVLEEPHDALGAGSGSDGDADDEGAGPSLPAQGPPLKQLTICFGAASVRPSASAQAADLAPAEPPLMADADGCERERAAPAMTDAAVAATSATVAPPNKRRRKRRPTEQKLSDVSGGEAQHSDREAGAAIVLQPKVDPRQRTICFAAARARSAPTPGAAAPLPGVEGSQANLFDLSEPSPQAPQPATELHTTSAAEPDGLTQAAENAAVDACRKKRRQRKRSKAEQPAVDPAEAVPKDALVSGSVQPRPDARQQTLTFISGTMRPVPNASPLLDAAHTGKAGAAASAAMTTIGAAPASTNIPMGPSADEVPVAEVRKKRAYRKRSKVAAEARPAEADDAREAPTVKATPPEPQADSKQRKLTFAAAGSRAPPDAAGRSGPADQTFAADDTQPADAEASARGEVAVQSPGASAEAVHCKAGEESARLKGCAVQGLPIEAGTAASLDLLETAVVIETAVSASAACSPAHSVESTVLVVHRRR